MASSNDIVGKAGNRSTPSGPASAGVTRTLFVDGTIESIDARPHPQPEVPRVPQTYTNRPVGLPPTALYSPVTLSTVRVTGVPTVKVTGDGAIAAASVGARPARKLIRVEFDPARIATAPSLGPSS